MNLKEDIGHRNSLFTINQTETSAMSDIRLLLEEDPKHIIKMKRRKIFSSIPLGPVSVGLEIKMTEDRLTGEKA